MPLEHTISAVALVVSLGTLGALFVTVVWQIRETKTVQVQSMRGYQLDLLRLACEYPDLQLNIRNAAIPADEWRAHAYRNQYFMYIQTGFIIGALSATTLRTFFAHQFTTEAGRRYWERGRAEFVADARTKAEKRFIELADSEFGRTHSGDYPSVV